MNKHSEDLFKEIDEFFRSEPSVNQKAWGLIHDFYHMILTYMEQHNISKADLAKRLGKSRSAITQMFNKTPNITIRKMVEIADAIGIDIHFSSPQIRDEKEETTQPVYVSCQIVIPTPDERFIEHMPAVPIKSWSYTGVTIGKLQ